MKGKLLSALTVSLLFCGASVPLSQASAKLPACEEYAVNGANSTGAEPGSPEWDQAYEMYFSGCVESRSGRDAPAPCGNTDPKTGKFYACVP